MTLNTDVIHTERCARAFGNMFWAFLFFLDIRIGINGVKVDILPDIIGWIIIVCALSTLLDLAPVVRTLRTLSYWLLGLSVLDLVQIERPRPRGGFHVNVDPLWALGLAVMVINIVFVWRLCGLIMEMASAAGDRSLREDADFRRKLYIAVPICIYLSIFLVMLFPPLVIVAILVALLLAVIVFCLLMGLMRRTAALCRGRVAPAPRDRWPEPPSDWP